MYDVAEYEKVRALLAGGLSTYEVARRTRIPRSTIQNWRQRKPPYVRPREAAADWTAERAPDAYCYLLGLYLGDGHVQRTRRGAILRLSMDGRYPALIDEAAAAMDRVFQPPSIGRYVKNAGAWVVLQICTPAVVAAFPQHGRGPKHARRIELAPWQRALTRVHAAALIRGLIQSDGCRTINRFTTTLPSGRVREYEYPRYFFSNLSADIRAILCEHYELLGVHWTQSNARNISVSRRDSVAILDELVGPKR